MDPEFFDKDLDLFRFFDIEIRQLNYSQENFIECRVITNMWNSIVPEVCGEEYMVKTFRDSIKWARDHYEEKHAEK